MKMKRHSYHAHRTQRLEIFIFLALSMSTLLLMSYPNLITAEGIAQSRRPKIKEEKITRAIFQITNRCPHAHHFRIASDIKDAGFKQQTDALLVDATSTKKFEVVFDAIGLRSNPKAIVECLDCKREEGCAQDHYEVPIEMTPINTALKSGPPVSTRFSSGLSTQGGANDVGIIPENSGGCPVGSTHVTISMDDEDNNNASSVSGWTGEISRYSTGTNFGFCRVDGNQFHSLPGRDYAVLQLGSTCPAGSKSTLRIFDNEHGGNNNWSSGTISPNTQSGTKTCMSFCFFPAGVTPTMSSFPNFYVPYGVFAAPPSLVGLPTGVVHTDDEDASSTHDYTCVGGSCSSNNCSGLPYLNNFAKIIYGTENGTPLEGKNTNLLVTKVANAPCLTPCPKIGSYDGANCWVGQPPAGTQAFIWATNFYYTPVNGNQCPLPGSSYDGANCFVKAIPSGTSPFIWANNWYVGPVCRP
jgi:hypothetical protein